MCGGSPRVADRTCSPRRRLLEPHPRRGDRQMSLEVAGLRVSYRSGGARVTVVDDVTFDIGAGEVLGLVGESGCGKSTIARAVAGLIEPDDGRIQVCGDDVT